MWNEYYEQTDGAAMENPLSPIVANIYMEYFEEMALQTAMVKPKMWLRYVDDTFVIWSGNMDELSVFHQHLNSLRPSIQSMEEESEGQLPFLDVLVKKDNCRLITSVYRKKTHTDHYIHYTSDHHPRIKHGVIQCLMKRAQKICMTTEELEEERKHLQAVLQKNGYPEEVIRRGIQRATGTYTTREDRENEGEDSSKKNTTLHTTLHQRTVRETGKNLHTERSETGVQTYGNLVNSTHPCERETQKWGQRNCLPDSLW